MPNKVLIMHCLGADILDVVLFVFIAKAWRDRNPELDQKNNVRDFALINELTALLIVFKIEISTLFCCR